MSLEQSIEKLTGQFERFFTYLGDQAPAAAGSAATTSTAAETATESAPSARGRGRPPKSKPLTMDEVKAAAFKVKDAINADAAKKIIKSHGAPDLAKLKPEVFAAFIQDCEAALEAAREAAADEAGEDEL